MTDLATVVIPLLGGGLAGAAGVIYGVVQKVKAASLAGKLALAQADLKAALADHQQAVRDIGAARAAHTMDELAWSRASRLKTDRLAEVEAELARITKRLAELDPASAAVVVAVGLDDILSRSPGAGAAADRGAAGVRSAASADATLPAKGH